MQPQEDIGNNPSGNQNQMLTCSQCGAPMPKEMRFCRNCGNRLGEGPAEYTDTVLLPNGRPRVSDPFRPAFTSPIVPGVTGAVPCPRRRRSGGMVWILIIIALVFLSGGVMSALKKARRNIPMIVRPMVERSYFGVNNFDTTEGGVTFGNVEPPGSPADLAGLVGGDIISSFNGVTIQDDDQMMDLLRDTPPGKTVDVVYIRDGETKKTQLTTISQSQFGDLQRAYENRPEGIARLGFDTGDAHRVDVPGTKMYGVRLDDFNSNGPAALAGLEKGDIIIQFNDVPIRTVSEFVSRIHRAIPYTTVKFTILRGTEKLEIPVKLGK
jgi:membrane-associated protease RseP (regulator of RpoE activity)